MRLCARQKTSAKGGHCLELGQENALARLQGESVQEGAKGPRKGGDVGIGRNLAAIDRKAQPFGEQLLFGLAQPFELVHDFGFGIGNIDAAQDYKASAGGIRRKQNRGGFLKIFRNCRINIGRGEQPFRRRLPVDLFIIMAGFNKEGGLVSEGRIKAGRVYPHGRAQFRY